jgi:hypothetical protein
MVFSCLHAPAAMPTRMAKAQCVTEHHAPAQRLFAPFSSEKEDSS